MDIYSAEDKKIKAIAELKSGKIAKGVYRPSGLYAYVEMLDESYITVYDREL